MTTSRRGFLRFAGLGALAAALPACSSVLPAPDTTAPGFGTSATGTVRVWCRANTQDGLTSLVERFNAAQDRLTVELSPIPDVQYVTKLATTIRAREVPDLVDIDDINSLLFVYRDAFTDLTDLIADLGYADRLSPGHLALATVDGRQYGVPYLADNSAVFCNTRLFERAGLDVDEATTDLDALLDAARRITALGDDVRGWTFPATTPARSGSSCSRTSGRPAPTSSGARSVRRAGTCSATRPSRGCWSSTGRCGWTDSSRRRTSPTTVPAGARTTRQAASA
jgi:multiple sugar transport system substrate-binding protein